MATDGLESADDTRTVPVLDLHLYNGDSVGNPFRQYDKRNEKWRPMTTRQAWIDHPNPHVLPINGDYDGERIIPVADYDGELPITPAILDTPQQPENQFDCPNCGTRLTGYPESCPECDVAFSWK